MKYWSEELKKIFDTEDELKNAEKEHLELIEKERKEREEYSKKRKAAAADVETKLSTAVEATKIYREALRDFCQEYGSFHYSVKNSENDWETLLDWVFGL